MKLQPSNQPPCECGPGAGVDAGGNDVVTREVVLLEVVGGDSTRNSRKLICNLNTNSSTVVVSSGLDVVVEFDGAVLVDGAVVLGVEGLAEVVLVAAVVLDVVIGAEVVVSAGGSGGAKTKNSKLYKNHHYRFKKKSSQQMKKINSNGH
ncbi:hypothetical protein QAD02_014576 [Eretmocerus hayati]|uniref:Uncharacterized protein n=1 Tax=Eretmocerus hayati TaxID=131215 RepID=A0ACC2P5C8_9HYME|nr:hypothetical protein QAD02_014576 [Eretmocerus hayati]